MSDWKDPFADDEAARAREARRAERERRRREEATRESLGERVRSEIERDEVPTGQPETTLPAAAPPPTDQAPPAAPPPPTDNVPPAELPPATEVAPPAEPVPSTQETLPAEPIPPAEEPPPAEPPTEVRPAIPPLPPEPPTSTGGLGPPPQPPRRSSSSAVRRRRMLALVGLGVLIVIVAVLGTIISRGGDSAPEPANVPAAKKTIEVVVPEGYDRTQTAEVAKKAGLKGDYMQATQSSKGFDPAEYGAEGADSLEGFLFPATYEVFKGAKVEDLVAKQLEAFEANAGEIDLEGKAKDLGYTPYEVLNVAAMVEREIAVPEERKLAASVIYNRLDQGTPLGIDATIRFEDHNYSDQLVLSRLEEDTPYNTRTNSGLPPGPIGNPGLASLEAAANPADSDYFFFVVKPGSCNEHTFVETEDEFLAAEAEYQAALQAEGGSPTEC